MNETVSFRGNNDDKVSLVTVNPNFLRTIEAVWRRFDRTRVLVGCFVIG